MRCRDLHRVANPAYLSRFPFSALPCVAPYCAPGGIRVVSTSPSYPRWPRTPSCTGSTTFFARQPTARASCSPQLLALPSGGSVAICKGFGRPYRHLNPLTPRRLASALNHRTLQLHESLLSNTQVGAVGRRMKRARPLTCSGQAHPAHNVTLEDGPVHRQLRARTTEPSR